MAATYEGFDKVKERTQLMNAITRAKQLSDKAWTENIKGKKFNQELTSAYEKWFGKATEERFKKVWLVVNVVNYALHSQKVTWKRVSGNPNNYGAALRPTGGWKIQTVKEIIDSGYTVKIGDAFFTNGNEEQDNTIIHEVSHIVANTEDEVNPSTKKTAYGRTACTALKDNYPDLAVKNADNYGYFHLEFQE